MEESLAAAKKILAIQRELSDAGIWPPGYKFTFGGAEIFISAGDAESLARLELERLKEKFPDLDFSNEELPLKEPSN